MKGACVLLVLAVVGVSGHRFRFGRCNSFTPVKDFDPSRMAGSWFVVKKVATTSSCLSAVYNVTGDKTMELREIRTPVTVTPFKIVLKNVGELTQEGGDPAVMRLRWDSITGNLKTTYTILDTDYDNYAIDAECQSLFVAKRESATILSRTWPMEPTVVARLEKTIQDAGFDLSSLNTVDHSNCFEPSEVDYTLVYDKDGVRAGLQDEDGKDLVQLNSESEVEAYLAQGPN